MIRSIRKHYLVVPLSLCCSTVFLSPTSSDKRYKMTKDDPLHCLGVLLDTLADVIKCVFMSQSDEQEN